LRIVSLEQPLKKLLATKEVGDNVRTAAADALITLSQERNSGDLIAIIKDSTETTELREKISRSLAHLQNEAVLSMFENQLKHAPRKLQIGISTILANSPGGIDYLLNALKEKIIDT